MSSFVSFLKRRYCGDRNSEGEGIVEQQTFIITTKERIRTSSQLNLWNELQSKKSFINIDLLYTLSAFLSLYPLSQIGSIAGNLMIKKMHPEFPSDIFLLFATVDAHVVVSDGVEMKEMCMFDFMAGEMSMKKKVILKVFLPVIKSASNQVVTYKVQ